MDAFENSAKLSLMLRGLTPLVQNLTKTAHFALKNSDGEDYLFQSIIDTLDDKTVELQTKSTIFQFIEVLINESFYISEQPKSHYNYPYVHNIKNALPLIIIKVLPDSDTASIHNIFNSLKNLSKIFKFDFVDYETKYNSISDEFTEQDLANLEENIPFPKVTIEDDEDNVDPLITTWNLLIKKKKQSQYERLRLLKHGEVVDKAVEEKDMFSIRVSKPDQPSEKHSLSKRQILARMEDDRETHKRSKEGLWIVNRAKDAAAVTEDEFLVYYWNKIIVNNDNEDKALLDSFEELNKLIVGSYKDKQF